jgi:hypothetical protein
MPRRNETDVEQNLRRAMRRLLDVDPLPRRETVRVLDYKDVMASFPDGAPTSWVDSSWDALAPYEELHVTKSMRVRVRDERDPAGRDGHVRRTFASGATTVVTETVPELVNVVVREVPVMTTEESRGVLWARRMLRSSGDDATEAIPTMPTRETELRAESLVKARREYDQKRRRRS